jgi:hypothetical protein
MCGVCLVHVETIMGFEMKPVNRILADEFHRESEEGVDAVFARMMDVVGHPIGGYASAFDVSENTLKTWRRRGAVSTKFLQGFAKEHGVSLDHLLYGDLGKPDDHVELSKAEVELIVAYRASPKYLRDAAIRVLLGSESLSAPGQKSVKVSAPRGNAAGRDLVVTVKKGKKGGKKD